jgi:hypothetical protein
VIHVGGGTFRLYNATVSANVADDKTATVYFTYDDGGQSGSSLLSANTIRRAYFREGDRISVEHTDGQRYSGTVNSYTPQLENEAWRVGFNFDEGGSGAAFLDDDFGKVRLRNGADDATPGSLKMLPPNFHLDSFLQRVLRPVIAMIDTDGGGLLSLCSTRFSETSPTST